MGNQKKYDVACIGNMVTDILIRGVRDDVMDHVEDMTQGISLLTGGDALNEAIACSRLGLKTALVGNLGDDIFGEYVHGILKQEKICTEGISRLSDCQTAVNVALIGDGGKRCILTAPVTNMNRMELTEKGAAVLRKAGIISIGSLFISRSLSAEMVQRIYREAKENGTITVADTSFRDPTEWKDVDLYSWIRGLDYFLPSYEEGQLITGETETEAIVQRLLPCVRKAVVLKMGAQGCLACDVSGELCWIPAYSVKVVDTTGAGDNFVAGFLWGLSQGWDLVSCCRCGCATGGLSATAVGASGGVRSAEQVCEFMHNNN